MCVSHGWVSASEDVSVLAQVALWLLALGAILRHRKHLLLVKILCLPFLSN